MVSKVSRTKVREKKHKRIRNRFAGTAQAVCTAIAKKALEKGITEVVFDRGGFIYHGKIQALADAAREAGLQF